MQISIDLDEVIGVKEKIIERLGLKGENEGSGLSSTNPYMKKIRLFSLIKGLELMNNDLLESLHGQEYLFYSFGELFILIINILGEDFDFSVRMEFITLKKKLGEGGFGSVYLAQD